MNTIKVLAVALLVALLVTGCTLTRGSYVLIGTAHPPTTASQVTLYTTLPPMYEKIAFVSADSRNDFASEQNLSDHAIERLKEEAAKVGANGLLLNGIGNYQVGSSGVAIIPNYGNGYTTTGVVGMDARIGKEAKGLAIWVPPQH
jgi:hypothetical protein